MLFAAAVDVNSQEYKMGILLGALTAGAICGLWPLMTGLSKGRPIMGIIGFFSCVFSGYVLGCLLGLPVAFFFKSLIGLMGHSESSDHDPLSDASFNPYANVKRSSF